MKQVKILHCGDIHLGAELTTLGRKAVTRRAEIKRTFMKILKLCQTEQVQILLIAGDFFDNVHVEDNVLGEIKNGFEGLKDTIVAIAPGNHDPLTEDSPYLKKDFWPENVIIFKSALESVEIENLGVRLWGAAFTGTYVTTSMLQNFTVTRDELINICVIHGELVAPNQKSNYNPITEIQLSKSRMDYVALGHIHKQTEVLKTGDTYYAYSGCPEGRGFDELDEKGVYLGIVAKGLCKLGYRRMCQRMNIELHVDISEAINSKMAVDIILDKMKSKYGENYSENLYKVILKGMISDNVSINIEDIKNTLDEVYFIKIKDHTTIKIDFDSVSTETTLRNIFMRKMMERINDAAPSKKEDLNIALRLGVKAFFGEVKYSED
ncbi:DNA repair exonuclease [Clostridium sp.]|uniref:metallophosphoesterase family protein n=1 Tax=Clostridium sp. TaxID=1506 RepID=UPI001A60D31E|nr:DNA repair exonuclease [Clostridium sp.]MBK5243187.1 DNA repair exonuclease [Clostridium sp.]